MSDIENQIEIENENEDENPFPLVTNTTITLKVNNGPIVLKQPTIDGLIALMSNHGDLASRLEGSVYLIGLDTTVDFHWYENVMHLSSHKTTWLKDELFVNTLLELEAFFNYCYETASAQVVDFEFINEVVIKHRLAMFTPFNVPATFTQVGVGMYQINIPSFTKGQYTSDPMMFTILTGIDRPMALLFTHGNRTLEQMNLELAIPVTRKGEESIIVCSFYPSENPWH